MIRALTTGYAALGIILALAGCGSKAPAHSAAWRIGYNTGRNYIREIGLAQSAGSAFANLQCQTDLNNMTVNPGWSPSEDTDFANGFVAGCEKKN